MDFEDARSALESFVGEQVSLRSVVIRAGRQLSKTRVSVSGVLSLGLNALDAEWQSQSLRRSADDGEMILVLRRVTSGELAAYFVLYAEDFVEAKWVEIDGQHAFGVETDNHQYTVSRGPGLDSGSVRGCGIAVKRLRRARARAVRSMKKEPCEMRGRAGMRMTEFESNPPMGSGLPA